MQLSSCVDRPIGIDEHPAGARFILISTLNIPPCATAVHHIIWIIVIQWAFNSYLWTLNIPMCYCGRPYFLSFRTKYSSSSSFGTFGYENAQVRHSRTLSHCSNIKMMNVHQYLPWWKQKNIFHVLFLSIEVMEGSASLSFPNIGHHPHNISHDHIFDQRQWQWSLINGWKW